MEPATTTLADSLLNDLDDLDDLSDEEDHTKLISYNTGDNVLDDVNNVVYDDDDDDEQLETKTSLHPPTRKLLLENQELLSCLSIIQKNNAIEKASHTDLLSSSSSKNDQQQQQEQQQQQQHSLIFKCNRHLSALDEEMHIAHLELIQAYAPKFPELADLIVDPLQYKNAVSVIQNETDMTNIQTQLDPILNSNQILTISVAATTTGATHPILSPQQLKQVNQACAYMDQVQTVIQEFTNYVRSKMVHLAPNTCALVGPTIAAILLGLAGGLNELSKIPACNLQVLGQVKHNASSRAGMSTIGLSLHTKVTTTTTSNTNTNTNHDSITTTTMNKAQLQPHVGILHNCDLVQKCPSYLQKKALKTVASKLALAIRCDYVNVETGRKRTSENGLKFRADIEAKILKWEEPDKARVLKALPKPDLTTKKRRGGKRMRRLKERFEETELMKQANKRAFSTKVGEYGDDAMGLTLGMLDTREASGGNIKNQANLLSQAKKMRVANTKASRQNQNKRRAIQMSSGNSNGLASSMVFTPAQGLELVDPHAQRDKVREANAKWFSENTGFQSAISKSK